jgi:bacterioferritin-associated ferredoxin
VAVKKTGAGGGRGAGVRRGRPADVTVVCRCEEVTEDQIRQVIREGHCSLEAVKRMLRTGMGHCQGRGCLRSIARLIEEETGRPAADQQWPRSRPPLKPLPLGMLGRAERHEPDC